MKGFFKNGDVRTEDIRLLISRYNERTQKLSVNDDAHKFKHQLDVKRISITKTSQKTTMHEEPNKVQNSK